MHELVIIANASELLVKATLRGYSQDRTHESGPCILHDALVDTIWADWLKVFKALKQNTEVDVYLISGHGYLLAGKAHFHTYDLVNPELAIESLSVRITSTYYRDCPSGYFQLLDRITQIEGYADCQLLPKLR